MPRQKGSRDKLPRKHKSIEELFWSRVNKTNTCWLWTGAPDKDGYGCIKARVDGRIVRIKAHRFSYIHHRGEIPEGLGVLHTCDVPACVNPNHLFTGTAKDNMQDCLSKGRQPVGEQWKRSLTNESVIRIRELYANGMLIKIIANEFKVSEAMVSKAATGKSWSNIPGKCEPRGRNWDAARRIRMDRLNGKL